MGPYWLISKTIPHAHVTCRHHSTIYRPAKRPRIFAAL